MGSYVVHFIVYTLAMSGLICFALFIYKKVMNGGFISTGTKKTLEIEETMNVTPRKSLMIVRVGTERFLIASDPDKTTLISKLQDNGLPIIKKTFSVSGTDLSNNSLKSDKNIINIPTKDVESISDILPAEKEKDAVAIKQDTKTTVEKTTETNEKVHLEVITDMNPAVKNRGNRNSAYISKNHNKKVDIEVGKTKNHGLSTIKEMALKVYEI